ncbi:MAG TPA: M48 family metalloprotease [Bryobacteraceae bacterium]|nr:M48 family metalloprotease [Bryobacteraceae bacterium]
MGNPKHVAMLVLVAACGAVAQIRPLSAERERALGRSLAADMERRYTVLTDSVLTEYFSRIGGRLAEAAELQVPLKVEVVDADEAFAASLPGGYLFLSAPLIAQNADGSLLSRILAHQVAHIAGDRIRFGIPGLGTNAATIPLIFIPGPLGFCSRYQDDQTLRPVAWRRVQKLEETHAETLSADLLRKSGLEVDSPGPPPVDRLHVRVVEDEKPPTLRRPGEAR